jgi:hypothetical protein
VRGNERHAERHYGNRKADDGETDGQDARAVVVPIAMMVVVKHGTISDEAKGRFRGPWLLVAD